MSPPVVAIAPPLPVEVPPSDLERQLAEATALVAAQTATIDKLEATIEASLKAPPPAPPVDSASENSVQLMYLLWNLKDQADSGHPFITEMDALREEIQALPNAPAEFSTHMDRLSAHARDGIPSLPTLREAFQHTIPEILRDARPLPSDAGAKEKLQYWLSHAVTIRRVDIPTDEVSVDAAIASIETALRDGNIELAEKEASALEKSGNGAIVPWLSQVRDALEVRQAISGLRETFHALNASQKTENAP